jgi:phosphatidylglycerol lysyltransferase
METVAAKINSPSILSFFKKLHWKELLSILFILIAFYFFRQQRKELVSLGSSLQHTNFFWLFIGIVFTAVYILLQAGMYVYSFPAVGGKITWRDAIELFLKRNVISVFLPAGGITALAYLPPSLRHKQVHKQQVHQASVIYGFIGIFSVFIVAVPVLLYLSVQKTKVPGATAGFFTVVVMLTAAVLFVRSVQKKGKLYRWAIKGRPKVESFLTEVFSFNLVMKDFWKATLVSVFIEVVGIIHLYIAMLAAGVPGSIEASVVGYIVATIFLIISPFLRGMGAIEVSLSFILGTYAFSTLHSVEITLLFRFFEFWLPLVAGVLSYAAKGRHLFLRLLPPVLIFFLGLVNVFSVLTPPIVSRVKVLQDFIPWASIQASNFLVILVGLTLIITANFLIKGLRSAWILALTLSIVSCIGNISKALDYEEALLSLVVIVVLIVTRKQYRFRSNPKLMNIGIATSLATFIAVLIFGSIGFYYLDKTHFHLDFTWQQSIYYAFKEFVLVGNSDLKPLTPFGHEFIFFINALGVCAWGFLLYCLVRPAIFKGPKEQVNMQEAEFLLNQYGDSPLDYFKVSSDKLLYVSEVHHGFVSYKVATGFAVVLEEPVCSEDNKVVMIAEFENYCKKNGLKPVYYRVDEDSLYYFNQLKKKKIFIGQEAVLDISLFKLEGKDRKSLRNGLNNLNKKGYKTEMYKAPLPGYMIQALEQVSNEWLETFDMEELVFAQGKFDRNELRNQDIITVSDDQGRIVAFLNIIPDYTPEECTYDLIRKTADAPAAAMDALIVKLIEYAKQEGYCTLNLGMVPMAGIEKPENTAEQVVKFAYERIKRFKNYQGLRDFKEKYATQWISKFLVYENDFDLVQLPAVLNKVMQPA